MIALALLESINYEKKCERKQLIRKVEKFQWMCITRKMWEEMMWLAD